MEHYFLPKLVKRVKHGDMVKHDSRILPPKEGQHKLVARHVLSCVHRCACGNVPNLQSCKAQRPQLRSNVWFFSDAGHLRKKTPVKARPGLRPQEKSRLLFSSPGQHTPPSARICRKACDLNLAAVHSGIPTSVLQNHKNGLLTSAI